jgi:hypothetical protein
MALLGTAAAAAATATATATTSSLSGHKRKLSSRINIEVVEQVTKKVKISSIPLNSDTVAHVLPKLTSQDFESYMISKGPEEWKRATDQMSSLEVKKLMLMVISCYRLLPVFAVYLSLWEKESQCADFLYELGLGNSIRQSIMSSEPARNLYLCLLKIDPQERHIFPILPTLGHNQHYFCLNKNFVKNDMGKIAKRIDPQTLTKEDLYYKKLCSAHACVKLQRWSECFAFSLSALDDYEQDFGHLHDVLSYIVWSGHKMAVSMDWCLKVLEEARLVATSIEHTWRRIIVFQSCLIENGFFELEHEVYTTSASLFVQGTDFMQQFKLNHLQAKLMHIENNLVFQYCRQHYHSDCELFCEKPPCIDQSFEATSKLLFTLDACATSMVIPGMKEYFRGYHYLYSLIKRVHVQERSMLGVNLAIDMFELAREHMKITDPLYADLVLILGFLKKNPMTLPAIHTHFSRKTHTKNTSNLSQFFFRTMLITMYWDNIFQHFPLPLLITNAKDTEIKASNNTSYRLRLLHAASRIMDSSFTHTPDTSIEDFPVLTPLTKEREKQLDRATSYWLKEADDETFQSAITLQQQFVQEKKLHQLFNASNDIIKPKIPTSKTIIRKNNTAEQVYAFGLQIIETWTEA